MKRKKKGAFLKVLLFLFAIYSAVTLISLRVQIDDKNNQLNELRADVRQQTEKNAQIQSQLNSTLTDDQIARIARDELGYAFPNERVYVNVPGD